MTDSTWRPILQQSALCQDRLAPCNGATKFAGLGGRGELFGLRLDTQFEERFRRVLPDEPDLLFTHISEFSYLGHDR